MNKNTNTECFQLQKIKGDFAELICRHHFELMGYDVSKTGIEEISPSFAKLQQMNSFTKPMKNHLQNMPDFIAVCDERNIASFIEVKYRSDINTSQQLFKLSEELHKQYDIYIKNNLPVYFYLVTNYEPYIHVLKAKSLKYREGTGGFYPVGDDGFKEFTFFKSINSKKGFNEVYKEIISKFISQIIKIK